MDVKESMTKYLQMNAYERSRYSFISSFFKGTSGRFLDVGCCRGGLINYLEGDFEYFGVDGVDNDFPNFFKLDLNHHHLPFDDKMFDAISCCAVLEHLFYPLEMLQEMKRVLKDSGKILIALPNDRGLNSIFSFFKPIKSYDRSVYDHHWRFNLKTSEDFFNKEFETISVKPEFGPVYEKYLFWLKLKPLCTEWFIYGRKRT